MSKKIVEALTFDDVLLEPQYSEVLPAEVNIGTKFTRKIVLEMPIVSAAMDTVTESELAITLGKAGGIGVIHKNLSVQRQAAEVKKVKQAGQLAAAAVGATGDFLERAAALTAAGVDAIVVDTAHGHSKRVLEAIAIIKQKYPRLQVVGGNVATAAGAAALIKAGVDAVKVGVGPGSICTTRIVSGHGVPQVYAIMEAANICKKAKVPLIADGGIKFSGDIVKAIAAGADCVMLGGLLAGTKESPGQVLTAGGQQFKSYRGMGSLAAMEQGSKDRYGQEGLTVSKLVPEGVEAQVPYKGPVGSILNQLVGGLKSGMGYCGAASIKQLQTKGRFIRITSAGWKESHVHDVQITKQAPNYQLKGERL